MPALSNLDAFVARQSFLKLLTQSVEEGVYVVGGLKVRRLHDFARFYDSLLLYNGGLRRSLRRAIASSFRLRGNHVLDAAHSGIERLDALTLGLSYVRKACFLLDLFS